MLQRPLNWPALTALAEDHGVLLLLSKLLEESDVFPKMPAPARQNLEASRRAHLLFTLSMTAQFFHLAGRFDAAGIDAVVIKGPVLAVQAFGDSSLRQYVDIDLLVRHRDIRKAARLLEEIGFVSEVPREAAEAGKIPGQFLFYKEDTQSVVELHTERTLRYFPRPVPIEAFFARRTNISLEGRIIPALSPEDTLVFLCVHGSKHFWGRLMWVADVAGLVARQQSMDWSRVWTAGRETGTERMLRLGLRLAGDLLAAEMPLAAAAEVRADAAVARLAKMVVSKFPSAEEAAGSAFQRALFRMQMCGGFFPGAGYLMRLAFSTTEEDWGPAEGRGSAAWMDALRRPLRLVRKYRAASSPGRTPVPRRVPANGESSPERKTTRT